MTNAIASEDLVDVSVDADETLDEMKDISDPGSQTDYASRVIANWLWLKDTPSPGADAQSQSVTALTNPVPWLSDALDAVARIAALPSDWDGHGSPQLGSSEREYVVDILASINNEALPIPVVVPVSGGGIQLEWQHAGRELELEIVAGSKSLLFLKVYEDETAEEGCYPIIDQNKTQDILDWLIAG